VGLEVLIKGGCLVHLLQDQKWRLAKPLPEVTFCGQVTFLLLNDFKAVTSPFIKASFFVTIQRKKIKSSKKKT
jgi:hypothetical protein